MAQALYGRPLSALVLDICTLSGHMPPQLTLTVGQTRDRCTRRLLSGEGQVSGEQMSGHMMSTGGRGLWTTAGFKVHNAAGATSQHSSQLTAKTLSCCSQQAVAAANNMSVVSTFTPATFSPAGIHKPHATQPDLLLLLLLCDLSSSLCGRREITM